jgi:hypothetical protein
MTDLRNMFHECHAVMHLPIHPAALSADELLAQCDVQFTRRSGPGGQHRNKVSTAAVLLHKPTGIKAEASERRSQAENRTIALFRLRVRLALEVRLSREPVSVPSPLWRSRLRGGRIAVSASHDDFPALLAEALDSLAACQFDAKAASETLACSTSQLVKFLQKEPQAILSVNRQRRQRGEHPLR